MMAFARLPPRSPRSGLLIVGDGPLGPELRRLSVRLGIDESTTFLPFVPHQDLPWLLQSRRCHGRAFQLPRDFLHGCA